MNPEVYYHDPSDVRIRPIGFGRRPFGFGRPWGFGRPIGFGAPFLGGLLAGSLLAPLAFGGYGYGYPYPYYGYGYPYYPYYGWY